MGGAPAWFDWEEFRRWGSKELSPCGSASEPEAELSKGSGLERVLMAWAVVHENLVRGDRHGYVACFFYGHVMKGPLLVGEDFKPG